MAEFIQKTDTLNEGREKINAAIQDAEDAKTDARQAVNISNQAKQIAQTAEDKADSTQKQLDTIVIDGDSSVEAAQARVDEKGQTHSTLKDRIDDGFTKVNTQLVEINDQSLYTGVSSARIRKPVMTLVDDDGRAEVWTILKPFVERKGIPISSAIITNRVGATGSINYLTEEQIRYLSKIGFEFVSHTKDHLTDLESYPDDVIHEQYRDSREWLIKNGYNGDVIIYPFGSANDKLIDIASQYYRIGVRTRYDIDRKYNVPPIESYNLQRVYIDDGVENAKQGIDDAIANNGWFILGMHCHYPDFDINEVEEVVDYAISKGVEIKNFRDALKHFGNILELGKGSMIQREGVIGADGSIIGSKIGRYQKHRFTDVDFNKPLYEYPENVTTDGYITNNHAEGVTPTGRGGFVRVHRYMDDLYGLMIFEDLYNFTTYRRTWIKSSSTWSRWESSDKSERPTLQRSVNHYSVGARSSASAILTSDNFVLGDTVIANPLSELPVGITWDCFILEDRKVKLTLHNITDKVIQVGEVVWVLKPFRALY